MVINREKNIEWEHQIFDIIHPTKRVAGWRLKRLLKALGRDIKHCEYCGKRGTKKEPLTVHHKDRNFLNNESENLVVLCVKCHRIIKKELDALPRS